MTAQAGTAQASTAQARPAATAAALARDWDSPLSALKDQLDRDAG